MKRYIKNKPLVSIIILIENDCINVCESIDSAINQKYKNIEIIAIDYGTKKNFDKLIKSYGKIISYYKFNRDKFIDALNFGISKSKGEYLSFIVSECIYDPLKISIQIDILNNLKNNNVILFSDYTISENISNFERRMKYNDYILQFSKRKKSKIFPVLYDLVQLDTLLIPKMIINDNINVKSNTYVTNILEFLFDIFSKNHHKYIDKQLVYFKTTSLYNEKLDSSIKENVHQYYVNIINSISEGEINKLALTKIDFYKDMENIFKLKELKTLIKFVESKYLVNIQIAENDLIGNKFNGFDLHQQLRNRNIDSKQIVLNKESNDSNTYIFDFFDKESSKKLIQQRIIFESDIIHFHHIHKIFDLNYLPILSNLIPCVITLHEPFFLGGHCVHSFDCEKWKSHCYDCKYTSAPFSIEYDYSSLNFELTKQAIQNSQISVIVASDWMVKRVSSSPIWKNKKIYKIPFGVDETIFKPSDIEYEKNRMKLNISKDAIVLMCRSSIGKYKGTDIIKKALDNIKTEKSIVIITVDDKGLFDEYKDRYRIIEYGWIKDDYLLASLYQITDIFLMPSMYESFGMMALEAMSCGKMVLGIESEGSALGEVINSPKCGILSKPDDFITTLNKLINNIDEIKERGLLSLKHVRKNNSLKSFLDNVEIVYADIIKNHTRDSSYELILDQLKKHMPEESPLILKTKNNLEKTINIDKVLENNISIELEHKSIKKQINVREIFRKIVPYRIRKIIKNKSIYRK